MSCVVLSPLPLLLELDRPYELPNTLTVDTEYSRSPSVVNSPSTSYEALRTPTTNHPLAPPVPSSVDSSPSSSRPAHCTCCGCSNIPALALDSDEKEHHTSHTPSSYSYSSPHTTSATDLHTSTPHTNASSASHSHSAAPRPPLARHRWLLYTFTRPRHLLQLNLCQLTLHSALLYVSLLCLYQLQSATTLLHSLTPAWCPPLLLCFLVYLTIRSFVHTVFCLLRCRYVSLWRLPASHWFNGVRWGLRLLGLPLVVCSFAALSTIHPSVAHSTGLSRSYALLWSLTSILLFHLLLSWATFAFFLFIFPTSQLTAFCPFLPLDESAYPQGQQAIQRRKAGLSPARIAQLAWSIWTSGLAVAADGSVVAEAEVCSICMDELCGGEVVRRLECGHVYHQPCVDEWLAKRAVCPLCVRRVGKDEPEEQVEMVVV